MKKNAPNTAREAGRRDERGDQAAQWLQPIAAIRIGSGAR